MKQKIGIFLRHPMLRDYRLLFGLWMLLAVVAALTKMHSHNNFLIFRGVFWHTWQEVSLFAEYPQEYFDVNHYGPFFSMVFAPFAVVPEWLGLVLWCLVLTLFLWWAVRRSSMSRSQQVFIFWFCAHELLTALFMQQFNIAIAAIILLAFFLFSRHKLRFLLSLMGWGVVLFALPMLISSPEYIVGQYQEWYECLTGKNDDNMFALHQNISLLGMVRKISQCATYSDLWLIGPGLLLFALPYLRLSQYKYAAFRQTLLASVLMFVVLFSTGSESSGYIIALVGTVVWYTCVPWRRSRWDVALMVLVFVLSSLSPSDLFPAYLRREFVQPYALKALPVTLVWLKLCYEICTRDYAPKAAFR